MTYIIVKRVAGGGIWYYDGGAFQPLFSRAKHFESESEAKSISATHYGSYIVARKKVIF